MLGLAVCMTYQLPMQCTIKYAAATFERIPLVFISDADEQPVSKRGRLKDPIQEEAFIQVIEDLKKNDEEQTTIADLVENI